MTKNFNIPFIFILAFLISKEIFSYDSEKIVILCILCFLITAYYNTRTALHNSFLSISSKIEEELNNLLDLRHKLEKKIKNFWEMYITLESLLIDIYLWVKSNFQSYIKKANKNRILFNFHIIKDQLNTVVTDTLTTKYLFEAVYKAMIVNNFYFMLDKKINSNALSLNMSMFFNKLRENNEVNTFKELAVSKLNLDRCVVVDSNSYNINTLLLLNVKLK